MVALTSAQGGKDGPAGGAPLRPRLVFASGRAVAALRAAADAERERGTAFVMIPVLFGAGAAANFSLAREPAPAIVTVAALLALCGLASARPLPRALSAALLVFALGLLAASLEVRLAGTRMLGAEISTRITGRVEAVEHRADRPTRLTIDVIATERPHLRYAPRRIRVTARKLPEGIAAGATVSGVVRLLPPSGPVRPHSYDFSFQSYFQGIGASGFFLRGPELVPPAGEPGLTARLSALFENAREALAAHIRSRIGGPEGEIAAALIAGVRGGIPEADNEALRKTGLAHVLSISGLHMALVAGTVLGTMRALFALFPGFSSRHPVKKYAAAIALAAISLYLAISGLEVAAERSYIMFAVILGAVLFDRAALTMRNLALSAIIVLALSPHEIMGPSFQMSFAATAALIAAYGWYAERRAGAPGRAGRRALPLWRRLVWLVLAFAGGLVATSLIAGTATGLYAAWHFERMAPLGVVANLAAMPIVTVAVMPMAVAGTVMMPLGLDAPFFAIMGEGLAAMLSIARWLAARTPLDAVGLVPPVAVVVLSVALVILTAATTWLRAAALPLLAIGVLLIAGRQMPHVLIAEDGRLVAMALSDGRLAVDRPRPPSFELEDWSRALMADAIVKPGKGEMPARGSGEQPFHCSANLCLARHASGGVVASAATAEAAQPACATAALIVIRDATAGNPCGPAGSARIVTLRDLARKGSVAMRFDADGRITELAFAIGDDDRPWHRQRRFSREARGLPPYKAKVRAPAAEPAQGDVSAKAAPER